MPTILVHGKLNIKVKL